MSRQRIVTFRFEGIGDDPAESRAADWQYRGDPDHGLPALAGLPGGAITTKVNPIAGSLDFATFSPRLRYGSNDPDADFQVATTFHYRDRSPLGVLSSSIDDTTTDIPLDVSGLDGEVVHIDTEAIKLGSYSSDHDGNGNPGYNNCSRGWYAIENGVGATGHDNIPEVCADHSYWQGRVVEMHVLDDGAADDPHWLGIVRNVPSEQQGATMVVKCDSLWSVFLSRQLGQGNQVIEPREHGLVWFKSGDEKWLELGEYFRSEYESQVMKTGSWSWSDEGLALQVGQSLFISPQPGSNAPVLNSAEEPNFDGFRKDVDQPVREVLVYGKAFEDYVTSRGKAPGPIPTHTSAQPHHPVRIADAHFSSTSWRETYDFAASDFLEGTWGLGLGTGPLPVLDLQDTAWMEVDHLVYGWDGQAVQPGELTDMLHRWGWMCAPRADGTVEYKRWGMPTIKNVSDAPAFDPLSGEFEWDKAYDQDLARVEAVVGELPWRDGREISLEITGRPQPDWEEGVVEGLKIPEVSPDNVQTAYSLLSRFGQLLKDGFDLLTCKAPDPAELPEVDDWEIGDWVRVSSLPPREKWAVDDEQPQRVEVDDSSTWVGQIWGADEPIAGGAYTLVIVMPRRGVARLRSSAMEVVTVSADKVYCASESTFGATTSDNETFQVGDQVQFWTLNLALYDATVYQIVEVGADEAPFVRLDEAPPDVSGLIMRRANIDQWDNPDAVYSGVDRPWMALADALHTLGTNDVEGDVYGR